MLFRILFLAIAVTLFLAMNYYVYRRFLTKIALFSNHHAKLRWMIYLFFGSEVLYFALLPFNLLDGALYGFFSALIGVTFMLFVVALVYDLLHTSLHKIPFSQERRSVLKMVLDATMLVFALSYLFKGFVNGFKKPRIKTVRVAMARLQAPLCIVQISDVHLGKVLGKEFLRSVVGQINAQRPDLVVITGDLVDVAAPQIGDLLEPLRTIDAPEGVYFIPGNHEYFHGAEAIMAHIETLGVRVLRNASQVVGGRINLAGTLDMIGERFGYLQPDIPKSLQTCDAALPTVLLAHQPKIVKELNNAPVDLILSGHTHGGQIFPFGLLVMLDQPYLSGLYRHNAKTQIFVTNGTGYWGPPVRVLAPSEIVRLDLVPAL